MEVDHHANILKVAEIMKGIDDGFLTEVGFKLLENQIGADLDILKEGLSQKPLCRICCYMCIAFNLICYFQGYIQTLENPSDDLKNLGLETLSIARFFEEQLPEFQKNLTDKYAHIFYDVKVQSFKREIFGNIHHIPANPDMLPKDFDMSKLYK